MAGETIGKISVAALLAELGNDLEVRRSTKEGKRYPLYFATKWGPWPINTPRGQDFILENAQIFGPGGEGVPESLPEVVPDNPEESSEPEPKKGFWNFD